MSRTATPVKPAHPSRHSRPLGMPAAPPHVLLDTPLPAVHKVQLCCATLPPPLGLCAAHFWLVTVHADACHRWEVWQTRQAGGRSWGHVHLDLKAPHAGVGGGGTRIVAEWDGREAEAIGAVLGTVTAYPHCQRYIAWPGPNSNTFVAWVLRSAGVRHPLGWKALGRRYPVAAP